MPVTETLKGDESRGTDLAGIFSYATAKALPADAKATMLPLLAEVIGQHPTIAADLDPPARG